MLDLAVAIEEHAAVFTCNVGVGKVLAGILIFYDSLIDVTHRVKRYLIRLIKECVSKTLDWRKTLIDISVLDLLSECILVKFKSTIKIKVYTNIGETFCKSAGYAAKVIYDIVALWLRISILGSSAKEGIISVNKGTDVFSE